jgi:hypothetical protein
LRRRAPSNNLIKHRADRRDINFIHHAPMGAIEYNFIKHRADGATTI